MALDTNTGEKLWEYAMDAPIAPVGPSIGDGMLFIPTQGLSKENKEEAIGSIVAFGPQ